MTDGERPPQADDYSPLDSAADSALSPPRPPHGETVFELDESVDLASAAPAREFPPEAPTQASHATLTPAESGSSIKSGSGSRGSDLHQSLSSGRRRRLRRSGSGSGSGGSSGDTDFVSGTILEGKYELLEPLGRGGMAAVYKAWHLMLEKEVALKFIRPEVDQNERFRHRFYREARIASELVHKNVVALREFGETEQGVFYMIMDFCPGTTLGKLLEQQGPLDPARASRLVIQLLEALEEAHKLNVVHRDIKPENMMVDAEDWLRVLDFGLAKTLGDGDVEAEQSHLTRVGAVIGTPKYMSPEQALGSPCDTRSDLYSASIVFYELLTGKAPYQADSGQDMIRAHAAAAPVPLRERIPGLELSTQLEEVIFRGLEKRPEDRWQTAASFRQAIQDLLEDEYADDASSPALEGTFTDRQELVIGGLDDSITVFRVSHAKDEVPGFLWLIHRPEARRDALAGFLNQVELSERVEHPSLAQGLEAGPYRDRSGRIVYAFSELEDGAAESLADLIARGPLELERWAALSRDLLQALAKGHDFSISHLCLDPRLVVFAGQGGDGQPRPVLHGLGVVAAANAGWSNPVNDVRDLTLLMLEVLAGARAAEIGLELVKEEALRRAPERARPILERALSPTSFPHAGALLRALQIVSPEFLDEETRRATSGRLPALVQAGLVQAGPDSGAHPAAEAPAPAPAAPGRDPLLVGLVIFLSVIVLILLVVVIAK